MGLQQVHCPDFVKRKKYIQGKMLTLCHQPPNSVLINDSLCKQTAKFLTENSLGNLFYSLISILKDNIRMDKIPGSNSEDFALLDQAKWRCFTF